MIYIPQYYISRMIVLAFWSKKSVLRKQIDMAVNHNIHILYLLKTTPLRSGRVTNHA